MKNSVIRSKYGDVFALYIYDDLETVKGCVQIVHGMTDYIGRYEQFAKFLNQLGYLVVGIDVLGHGLSADYAFMNEHMISDFNTQYGYFGKNGFKRNLAGLLACYEHVNQEYNLDEYIMFGHSMGTILVSNFLIEYGNLLQKVILAGPVIDLERKWELQFASWYLSILNPRKYSKLIYGRSNGSFDESFSEKSSWITHDDKVRRAFLNDPFCTFKFTNNGYYEMFKAILKVIKTTKITFSKSLLIISGAEDSSGRYGKIATLLEDFYQQKELSYIKKIIYPKMRHELVNNFDSQIVYEDIKEFLEL